MAVETAPWAGILEGEELAHVVAEPARGPRTAPFPDELSPKVRGALEALGVHELYEHQADAWAAAQRGEHVAIVTGTASGKSLAFNLPVLDALAREPKRRALYLYPTKALAQDQLRSLTGLKGPRGPIATATPRSSAVGRSAGGPTWCCPTPTCTSASYITTAGRRVANLAYVVVDGHTSIVVCSARVGNVLRLPDRADLRPSPSSCSPPRRSRTRPARALAARRRRHRDRRRRRRARADDRAWNPELLDEELGIRAAR